MAILLQDYNFTYSILIIMQEYYEYKGRFINYLLTESEVFTVKY